MNNTGGIIIAVIIVFLLIVAAGVGALLYLKTKTNKEVDKMKEDGTLPEEGNLNPNSTITELPFKEIKDSMIYLGDDQYRMVIELSLIHI